MSKHTSNQILTSKCSVPRQREKLGDCQTKETMSLRVENYVWLTWIDFEILDRSPSRYNTTMTTVRIELYRIWSWTSQKVYLIRKIPKLVYVWSFLIRWDMILGSWDAWTEVHLHTKSDNLVSIRQMLLFFRSQNANNVSICYQSIHLQLWGWMGN